MNKLLSLVLIGLFGLGESNHRDPLSGVACNHMPYWTVGADVYVTEGTGPYIDGSEWSPMIHDGEPSIAGGNPGAPGACPTDMRFPPTCDLTQMSNQCTIFPPGQNTCVCRQTLWFETTIQPANIICNLAITPCWITRNGNNLPNPNCLNTACTLGTASLTFTPCPCAFGTVTVCATLVDGREMTGAGMTLGCIPPDEDRSPQQCFNIHVEQVNNCPTWNKQDITTVEDDVTCGRFATQVSAGCDNEGHNQPHEQDLTWKISCTNPALFSKVPTVVYHQGDTTADLCYTPAPDMSGCTTCTITLHDNGGTANGGCDQSAPKDVQVCITEVNDPPTFIPGPTTITLDEDAANTCNPSGCSQSEFIYANWATNRQVGPGWEVCRATCNPRQYLDRFDLTLVNPCQADLFETLPSIDVLTGDLKFVLSQHANTPGVDKVDIDVVLWDTGASSGGCLLINDITCNQPFSNTVRLTLDIRPVNDIPSFEPAYATLQLDEDEVFPGTVHNENWATNMCIGGYKSGSCADTGCQQTATGKCTASCGCTNTQTCPCDHCNELNAPESQSFVWSVVVDNQDLFTVGGQPTISNTGVLSFTLADDKNGLARIRATIQDDGGLYSPAAVGNVEELVLTVVPKNDQPTFEIPATYSTLRCNPCDQQTVARFATNVGRGSTWTDEDTQLLFWDSNPPAVNNDNPSLFSEQPTLLFSTDGKTADLVYTLEPGATGTATVTVTLRDDGDSANCMVPTPGTCNPCNGGAAAPRRQSCNLLTKTFTFTATDQNLPPTFTINHPGADVGVFEDPIPSTVTILNYASNSAGSTQEDATQTVTYKLSVSDPSLFTATGQPAVSTGGDLTFTPETNAFGEATVTMVAVDDGVPSLESDPQVFKISVFPVNDPPVFSHPPSLPLPPSLSYPVCEQSSGCPVSITSFATGLALGPPNEVGQDVLFWKLECPQHPELVENVLFNTQTGSLSFVLKQGAETGGNPTACSLSLKDNGGTSNNGEDLFVAGFSIAVGGGGDVPKFDLAVASLVKKEDDAPFTLPQQIINITPGTGGITSATCTSSLPEPVIQLCTIDTQSWDMYLELVPQVSGADPINVELCNAAGCASQTFNLNVKPVNDAPIITFPIPSVTIFEGSGVPSEVSPAALESTQVSERSFYYKIPVVDALPGPNSKYGPTETTQTLSYSVTDVSKSGLFTGGVVIDSTGAVFITTSGSEQGKTDVTFVARDDGGLELSGVDTTDPPSTFTITISHFNTRPTFLLTKTEISTTEPDIDTTLFFNDLLSSPSPGTYPEESQQKLVSEIKCPGENVPPTADCNNVVKQSSLDLETDPSNPILSVLVEANRFSGSSGCNCSVVLVDDGLQGPPSGHRHRSVPRYFTFVIEGVNDPPSFVPGPDLVTTMDASLTVPLWATDISAGPFETDTMMTFTVTAANPSLLQSVTINSNTGEIVVEPTTQSVGSTSIDICLKESSQSGPNPLETCVTNAATITILSDGVRGVPQFVGSGEITVAEDSGDYQSRWATGLQTGDISDTTRSLSNFRIVPRSGSELFSAGPEIALDGTLTFSTAADENGQAVYDIYLIEKNGLSSAAQQLVINVTPVNDRPEVVVNPNSPLDVTVLEDSLGYRQKWCDKISAGAANEDQSSLSIGVSVSDPAFFSQAPKVDLDCFLSFVPAANVFGQIPVSVTVTDEAFTSNPIEFIISVTPVNDPPSWIVSKNSIQLEENFGQASVSFASAAFAGPGESDQTLSVVMEYSDDNLLLLEPPTASVDTRTGLATIILKSRPNKFGSLPITVSLKDSGGVTNGGSDTSPKSQLVVTVNGHNDPPVLQLRTTPLQIAEDTQYSATDWIVSFSAGPFEDDQTITWSILSSQSALFASLPTVTQAQPTDLPVLTIIPAENAFGETVLTVRATDSEGLFSDHNIDVQVLSANDPPTYSLVSQRIAAVPGQRTELVVMSNILPGPPNEVSQTVTAVVSTNRPELFSSQPELEVATGTLSFVFGSQAATDVEIQIQLRDDGGTANGGVDASSTETIIVSVNEDMRVPSFELARTTATIFTDREGIMGSEVLAAVINTTSITNVELSNTRWEITIADTTQIPTAVVTDNTNIAVTYTSSGANTFSITLSNANTGAVSSPRSLSVSVEVGSATTVQIISNTPPNSLSQQQWLTVISNHLNIATERVTIKSVSNDYTGKTTSGSSVILSISPPQGLENSQSLVSSINSGTAAVVIQSLDLHTGSDSACVVPSNSNSDTCFAHPSTCVSRTTQLLCQQLSSQCLWISTALCVPTSCAAQQTEAECLVYPNWCEWSSSQCSLNKDACVLINDKTTCDNQSPICVWSETCRSASADTGGDGLPSWVIPVAVVGGILALIGISAALYHHFSKKSNNKYSEAKELPSDNSIGTASFSPDASQTTNPIQETFAPHPQPHQPLHPPGPQGPSLY
eukprot:TRINITY_DN7748_c0_g1_i2.p1 TRINITY_DN7748_c0_g1~~TRINITY_DN7748_c0_g1_i2.p1  ORF type:complete len:2434 (+),score=462.88 TRINITY_DN7748_c0_g1_i2:91-7392(+)